MLIAGNEPDLIMVTEVLPKAVCNNLSLAQLFLQSYHLFLNFDFNDPKQTAEKKRGVAIYVSDCLSA